MIKEFSVLLVCSFFDVQEKEVPVSELTEELLEFVDDVVDFAVA